MSKKLRKKIFHLTVYILLLAAICWQGFYLYKYSRTTLSVEGLRSVRVKVDGNVRQPGIYLVPEGTTQFEILKVAGIRPTSDLSAFQLIKQLEDNAIVNVGTLQDAVDVNSDRLLARLEFYLGEINIISSDGRNVTLHEGIEISKGYRVLSEASAQAEISIGANSRIDMDNFAELTFDKIGEIENNRSTVELFQKSGTCWYRTVYSKDDFELFRILTPQAVLTVGGTGADFLVDIQKDHIQINLMDGLILLERLDNSEAINLISGQSAKIYNDGRPFEVTRLSSGIDVSKRFSQLNREKINHMNRFMPFNLLFCGPPAVFYVISIQYESSNFHLIRVPSELLIEQFSKGISTIGQAYLYGGPVFVSTFLERILNIRISRYCVFDKDDLMRAAGALGGVQINIDEKAASALNVEAGTRRLNGQDLLYFMSPSISGVRDCQIRQAQLIKSLFEGFSNKSISLTLLLAEQILTNTEANFLPFEVMEQYAKFNAQSNWKFKEHDIPAYTVKRGYRDCYEPILEKCRELLRTNE